MANVNGSSSVFPGSIDDWGSELQNNTCQIFNASLLNHIEDALFTTEVKTRRTFLTGKGGIFAHPPSGTARPQILFKSYTASVVGTSTTVDIVVGGPAFTSAEKAAFGGTPFASGNLIHVQIRKVPGDASTLKSYHAGLQLPLDTTGDSGFIITASTARHGNGDFTISTGTYVISLMITNN